MMDTRFRIPRCIFTSAESDTTMALSTNIPMAIIMAASDMLLQKLLLPHHNQSSSKYGEYKSATYQQTIFETDEEKQDSHYGNYGNYQIDDKALLAMADSCP